MCSKLGSEYFLNLKLIVSEVKAQRQHKPLVQIISTSSLLPDLIASKSRDLGVDPWLNLVGEDIFPECCVKLCEVPLAL